jgi:hypothetical protein
MRGIPSSMYHLHQWIIGMKGKKRGGIFAIWAKTLAIYFHISGENLSEVKTNFYFDLFHSSIVIHFPFLTFSHLFHSQSTTVQIIPHFFTQIKSKLCENSWFLSNKRSKSYWNIYINRIREVNISQTLPITLKFLILSNISHSIDKTHYMLEHVWKLSKKTKHKFSCWVELVLCELKKVEVPHRMEHTH